jgi:hypothetical protein
MNFCAAMVLRLEDCSRERAKRTLRLKGRTLSKASIKELAGRYDLNPKTVTKWKKRAFVHDAPMGPKAGKLKKSAEPRRHGERWTWKQVQEK